MILFVTFSLSYFLVYIMSEIVAVELLSCIVSCATDVVNMLSQQKKSYQHFSCHFVWFCHIYLREVRKKLYQFGLVIVINIPQELKKYLILGFGVINLIVERP